MRKIILESVGGPNVSTGVFVRRSQRRRCGMEAEVPGSGPLTARLAQSKEPWARAGSWPSGAGDGKGRDSQSPSGPATEAL